MASARPRDGARPRSGQALDFDAEVRVSDARGAAQLHQYVSRRLRSAVRPFRDRVGRVTVRVVDENGPKGGMDTRCSIALELRTGRRVFVHAISAWPHAAVSLAARRLTRMVTRVTRTTNIPPASVAGATATERDLH